MYDLQWSSKNDHGVQILTSPASEQFPVRKHSACKPGPGCKDSSELKYMPTIYMNRRFEISRRNCHWFSSRAFITLLMWEDMKRGSQTYTIAQWKPSTLSLTNEALSHSNSFDASRGAWRRSVPNVLLCESRKIVFLNYIWQNEAWP